MKRAQLLKIKMQVSSIWAKAVSVATVVTVVRPSMLPSLCWVIVRVCYIT